MSAISDGVTGSPWASWLVSKFWQKTQLMLQWARNIVPLPLWPRRTSSSP